MLGLSSLLVHFVLKSFHLLKAFLSLSSRNQKRFWKQCNLRWRLCMQRCQCICPVSQKGKKHSARCSEQEIDTYLATEGERGPRSTSELIVEKIKHDGYS